ncbi:DUF4280 domain-containing protein [Clostridium thailandense]|uniref:DUF4280 domain-containing protein n=1 Tax=Clostridium thailandense TaxID=2794346 RepID=UPI0039890A8F
MDKIYVVDGATLQCSFGSEESIFKVSPGREAYTNGQLQANTGDFKPMVNIMTFKKCSSPSNPAPVIGADDKGRPQKICTPVITMPWINGKENTLIEGCPALLDNSTTMCMWCGKITISDDGQQV